jgi:hypothetical protein
LLFFGNFSRMDEDAFIDAIVGRLHDDDMVFRTMARDIHQAGSVLQNKKYRLLGYAYRMFLVGLIASCAAYVALYLV